MHANSDLVGIQGIRRAEMKIAVSSGVLVSVGHGNDTGRYRVGFCQKELPGWPPREIGLGEVMTYEHFGNHAGEGIQPRQIQSCPVEAGGLADLRDAEVGVSIAQR